MSWPAVIVLDCGETLFDETRQWATWAQWLGVTPFSLIAVLGAVLQRGEPFTNAFALFDPDFDIDREIERRRAAGCGLEIGEQDLHPDVRPACEQLAAAGLSVAIAGTMTEAEQHAIAALALPVSMICASRELGRPNREPEFFHALADRLEVGLDALLYVSHRPDTAGRAAAEAGVAFGYLRRGPVRLIRPPAPDYRPRIACDSLAELAAKLTADAERP